MWAVLTTHSRFFFSSRVNTKLLILQIYLFLWPRVVDVEIILKIVTLDLILENELWRPELIPLVYQAKPQKDAHLTWPLEEDL